METAVGEGATESLVEEQEQEGDVHASCGQAVGVSATIALQQPVSFELAEIVTELIQSVLSRGKLEAGDDCLVNVFGRPAANGTAVMQENLQEPNDPGVMDFDTGITSGTNVDGQSDP